MAMVAIVIGFVQLYVDLGISAAIIYRQDATADELSSLYWLNIVTGLIAIGLIWAATPLVVAFYGEPRLAPLLRVVSLLFLLEPWVSQFDIMLQRELRFNVLARQEVVNTIVGTAVAITAGASGQGAWS